MFLVSGHELRDLISIEDAIEATAEAFTAIVDRTADQPTRISLSDQSALGMLARRVASTEEGPSGTAFKLLSIRDDNRRRGLPTVIAIALWFDGETGLPGFLVDGMALTALRTGAAAGLATRLLAEPESEVMGMIGAGAQAADQVRAVCSVRPITTVRICSRSQETASLLAQDLAAELAPISVVSVPTAREAIDGADVITCATNSKQPVFRTADLKTRVHVNAVGSFRPDMHEVPADLFARAELVAVDELASALAEAGDLLVALDHGLTSVDDLIEIGTIVRADVPVYTGITVFKSVGLAMQDWAVCRLLSERLSSTDQHLTFNL